MNVGEREGQNTWSVQSQKDYVESNDDEDGSMNGKWKRTILQLKAELTCDVCRNDYLVSFY